MASIFHRAIKKRIPFRESFPKDALWCRIRLTRVFLTMWLLPTLPIPFIWFRVYVCVYSSLFPLDIIVFGILETLVGPNLSSQVSTSYSASCITLFLPFDAVLSFVLPSPPRPPPFPASLQVHDATTWNHLREKCIGYEFIMSWKCRLLRNVLITFSVFIYRVQRIQFRLGLELMREDRVIVHQPVP